jgi:hypothetical protein
MSAPSTPRRPWIVDFLSTLFLAFSIGIATSVVLGAAVVLMAGEARGADGAQLIETVPLEPSDQPDTVLIDSAAPASCPERSPGAAPASGGRTCDAGRDRGGERCRPARGEGPRPECRAARDPSARAVSFS